MLLHYGWLRIEKKRYTRTLIPPFSSPGVFVEVVCTKNSQQQSNILSPGAAFDAMHYPTVEMDVESCLVAKPDEGAVGLLMILSSFFLIMVLSFHAIYGSAGHSIHGRWRT